MNEYQTLFLAEAGELFSSAYDTLLPAEEADALEGDAVDELFRIIHTLKGSSGGVDFDHLCRYAHQLENLLERLREGEILYQSGMAGFLVDAVDQMQDILAHESKNNLNEEDFARNLETLEKKVAAYGAPQGAQAPDEGFVLFDEADYAAAAQPEDDGFVLFDEDDLAAATAAAVPPESPPQQTDEPPAEKPIEQVNTASIRVDLGKIDQLLNRVGELVIVNSMLGPFADKLENRTDRDEMNERLTQLQRHIRDLQEAVMGVRMIPIEHIYAKFPKIVRDISRKLGKQVRLSHSGDSVEIDKMMIEGLTDPLTHIIRNSLDHGIETPDERRAAGKDPTGVVTLAAMQENGQMVITVTDDGRGIDAQRVIAKAIEKGLVTPEHAARLSDEEKIDFIFSPGLSTAQKVSDISGRGVGMDVVRSNIAKLGGIVRLKSKAGSGTRFTIVLPLTLAILDGLNVGVGECRYILPLSSVVESLQPSAAQVKYNGDGTRKMLMLRERFIPVIELHELFKIPPKYREIHEGMLIVVRAGEERFALFVDEFGTQQQVVVKSLEKNFRRVGGIGGATVQGDGSVALILDPLGILEKERETRFERELAL